MEYILSQLQHCSTLGREGISEYDQIVVVIDRVLDILDNLDIENDLIRRASMLLESLNNELIHAINTQERRRGRPRINVSEDLLHELFQLNFSISKISKLLGISRQTIYRRLRENGMPVQRYASLNDEQLDAKVTEIVSEYPRSGYRRIDGYLKSRGFIVKQLALRRSVKRVDPSGVFQRTMASRIIVRRKYFVAKANGLWHIDTHMKLVRWNFIVRGGIDGKSRLITFLEVSDNNTAADNLHAFIRAVERYGLPSRTRTDKGLENIHLARYMLTMRGTGRGSHICGRSVHNQRIERLWSDVFHGLLVTFYALFSELEANGDLDINNPLHMAILHYVFMPRIHSQLQEFAEGWNSHTLSTEHNMTPKQLFVLHIGTEDQMEYIDERNHNSWNDFVHEPNDLERIFQPNEIINPQMPRFAFTAPEAERLSTINPMEQCSNYGVNIYLRAINLFQN